MTDGPQSNGPRAATVVPVGEYREGYGHRLAASPVDDLWVAADSAQFHVWQGEKRLSSVALPGHDAGGLRISADGRFLLVGALAYDLSARHFVDLPPLPDSLIAGIDRQEKPRAELFEVSGAAWRPDARQVAVATQYRPPRGIGAQSSYTGPRQRLLLLDGRTRALIAPLWEGTSPSEMTRVVFEPGMIAAGGQPILVWDSQTHRQVAELHEHTTTIRDLAFSPDRRRLASAGWDGLVVLWDTRHWRPAARWQAHDGPATAVAFHPHQPLLATGGGGQTVKVWSLTPEPAVLTEISLEGEAQAIVIHPRDDRLIVALDTGTIVVSRLRVD